MADEYYVDDNCGWGPQTVRRTDGRAFGEPIGEVDHEEQVAASEQFGERYNAARLEGGHDYALWFAGLPVRHESDR